MGRSKSKKNLIVDEDEVYEKPHPMLKVPGVGNRATWNKRIGRWVVPVIGGEISDERNGDSRSSIGDGNSVRKSYRGS